MGVVSSAAAAPHPVTLTWQVPRVLADRITPAARDAGLSRREWLADAVAAWGADQSDVQSMLTALPGHEHEVTLPREVVNAVAMNRAARNRSVVGAWTAFMTMARWRTDVLAAALGVTESQVLADAAAGRALLSKGEDMREVSRLLPPVLDPPDAVAVPPVPDADRDETVPVRAWIDPAVKQAYQHKRGLLGWGSTQAGCVLLLTALSSPTAQHQPRLL